MRVEDMQGDREQVAKKNKQKEKDSERFQLVKEFKSTMLYATRLKKDCMDDGCYFLDAIDFAVLDSIQEIVHDEHWSYILFKVREKK